MRWRDQPLHPGPPPRKDADGVGKGQRTGPRKGLSAQHSCQLTLGGSTGPHWASGPSPCPSRGCDEHVCKQRSRPLTPSRIPHVLSAYCILTRFSHVWGGRYRRYPTSRLRKQRPREGKAFARPETRFSQSEVRGPQHLLVQKAPGGGGGAGRALGLGSVSWEDAIRCIPPPPRPEAPGCSGVN